jgi:HK97 family phage portal protein
MDLFGLRFQHQPFRPPSALSEITRSDAILTKRLPPQIVSGAGRGWYSLVHEPWAGAWQQNQEQTIENITAHVAVFACVSLIASDIGKTRCHLSEVDANRIWTETENPAFSPVLRKPNGYQIRNQFFEGWQTSKLLTGNTYVLKRRDRRNIVDAMYILDPQRVRVLMAPDASVFYELDADAIGGIEEKVIVPAREIIHDIYLYLSHPLIGVSPLYACGRAAIQGLTIQNDSTNFFASGSKPSGVLTAPGAISQEAADRIKEKWETKFSGANAGKVAVLGDGLTYEAMTIPAAESQLLKQLQFTGEMVCMAFRVPPHKIGIGPAPSYNNIQALDLQYYAQCLQEKIEKMEELLDQGLELPKPFGTEFDLDDLARMDTKTLIESEKEAAGIKTVNESRKRLNLPPVEGGDTVYIQQQNFSIEALNRRDQAPAPGDPQGPTPDPGPIPPGPAEPPATPADEKTLDLDRVRGALFAKIGALVTKHAA